MHLSFILSLRYVSVLLLFLFSYSCVSSTPSPELQQLTQLPRNICKIAVLPFQNDSEYLQGDIVFYRIFVAELNRIQEYSIVQEGDVRKMFRQMRISPKDTITLEQMLIVADRLEVDAVVVGTIIKMQEKEGKIISEPELAVDLRLLDAFSGKMILTTYHSRKGEDYRKVMHFGLVNTITELSGQVAREVVKIWKDKGLAKCTD